MKRIFLAGCGLLCIAAIVAVVNDSDKASVKAKEDARAAHATSMGVSADTYHWADRNHYAAVSACQDRIINAATWGAESHPIWNPPAWVVDRHRVITIRGTDITVNNAFGAKVDVEYQCKASVPADADEHTMEYPLLWSATVDYVIPLHRG